MKKETVANLKRKLTAVSAAIICASACLFCCACGGNDSKEDNSLDPVTSEQSGGTNSASKDEEENTASQGEEANSASQGEESNSDEDDMNDYADSLSGVSVGDTVKFGAYEQDNDTSNGKEVIEWRVLAVEDGKALLISEYALDSVPYNTEYTGVTWETCSLRKWLNDEFLNDAFDTDHQDLTSLAKVTADKNPIYDTDPGNTTTDKVFLLSINEANKYFDSDEARICAPTVYARAQGANISSSYFTTSGAAACWWWLRTPGDDKNTAACVCDGGWIPRLGNRVSEAVGAIRPAIWVNIEP